jgi:hypothetical protein
MRLLIQLTFNNGLGNLYCGAVELLNFANHYKNLGYTCELIFASNGNAGGNKFIDYVEFEEIFDTESFGVFDKITNKIHSWGDKQYEGYTYHSTQYGPNYPGAHWWDVFFDESPDFDYPKYQFNMETLVNNIHIPNYIPKLNKKIYEKVDKFIELNGVVNNAIQIRFFDFSINPPEDFKEFCQKIKYKVSDLPEKFYFTSHNKYAVDLLTELENIVTYKYENMDELPNDHSYYFYNKHFSREVLLNRLYDNLAEMVLLSKFKKIYYSTSYGWMTTFLYYAKSNNMELELININNNLDLIT